MRIASHVVAALLGLVFAASGVVVLFNLAPPPPPFPEGSPAAQFMAAFSRTGYLQLIKVLEILGGVLVALPWTRRAGLLVLGPILVNIVAFHALVLGGEGLFSPLLLVLLAFTMFLVWVDRAAFLQFLRPSPGRKVPA